VAQVAFWGVKKINNKTKKNNSVFSPSPFDLPHQSINQSMSTCPAETKVETQTQYFLFLFIIWLCLVSFISSIILFMPLCGCDLVR